MNERLEILVLNQSAEVYTRYVDVESVLLFLRRISRVHNFSIVAHKGKKAIFIEKLEPATLAKVLNEFQKQT